MQDVHDVDEPAQDVHGKLQGTHRPLPASAYVLPGQVDRHALP